MPTVLNNSPNTANDRLISDHRTLLPKEELKACRSDGSDSATPIGPARKNAIIIMGPTISVIPVKARALMTFLLRISINSSNDEL